MLFLSFDGTAFIFWKVFSFYCFTLHYPYIHRYFDKHSFFYAFWPFVQGTENGSFVQGEDFQKVTFLSFFPDFVHSYHLFFYIRLCFLLVFLGSILSNISIRSGLYHHLLLWQHALSFGWRHLSKWTSI